MANLPDLETARYLIIRRDNIGDLVCTTPLIRALRQRYPRARIAVLVNSYNRPVVENNPDIDGIYDYTKAKHRGDDESLLAVHWRRLRMMLKLRRERFDYAIIAGAHFLPRGLKLARRLQPRHIVGFTEDGARNVGQIDIGIPYLLPRPMHEAEDVFRLLAPLGISGTPPPMQLFPAPAALNQVKAAVHGHGLEAGSLVAVHISARKPSNRWPAERFVELIRRLHAAGHGPFMLLWSPGLSTNPLHPGDDEKAGQIMAGVCGVPMLAYPTTRLDQLIAALACCKAVVCSDGGAMHVAAALGKPLVCFFGQSDSSRWYPWGVEHVLLQPASQDVADVSVDEATAAFEGVVKSAGAVA
jgi:ADP-heptose:LPS heptosyltransferase